MILAIVLVVIVIGYVVYTMTVSQDTPEQPETGDASPTALGPSETEDASPTTPASGSTLTITEDGASVKENYRIMPKRERYIQMPNTVSCHGSYPQDYCSAYDKNDGLAVVYDLSLSNSGLSHYTECPGGGHDCWYTEKFDQDGSLIAVTNKQGESLIDKLADDLWSDKVDVNHAMFREIKNRVEIKNGVLVASKEIPLDGSVVLQAGNPLKPMDLPGVFYFMILLIAMKQADMEKPGKIVLKIRGARDRFIERISGSHTVQYQAPTEPPTGPPTGATPMQSTPVIEGSPTDAIPDQ